MSALPVVAVFDAGKTNKKFFLFDEDYNIVFENTTQLAEIKDEDGFPCENLNSINQWLQGLCSEVMQRKDFSIKAYNFSAYGASFVHLDKQGQVLTPLYNYLKPYTSMLMNQFYTRYGGKEEFSKLTCSPPLGSLNSGMQLYRIKCEQPDVFEKIACSLHLPQYLSYLLSGSCYSEITSIGCHTNLWNFIENQYHHWVHKEDVFCKLAPIVQADSFISGRGTGRRRVRVGTGLHDSSAALVPYLKSFNEPFILISTGTWCVCLNPFNRQPLTMNELQQDCLCYLTTNGNPVKASRLFIGNNHEQQIKEFASRFNKATDYYKTVDYNPDFIGVAEIKNYEQAYHKLMYDIVTQQTYSTQLVMQGAKVSTIYVDGGFSSNTIYMNLLAKSFPGMNVYAASVPQASALGAAVVMHKKWNSKVLSKNIIPLKHYPFLF